MAVLRQILTEVQGILSEAATGQRNIVPLRPISWKVGGRSRRHIICDEIRLRSHANCCVVGFFGDRRTELDFTALEKANRDLVAEFASFPEILGYSSIEVGGGQWGNMVLHEDPGDTESWRELVAHARAVESLARFHYRTVRIHNAELSAPLLADPSIVVKRTKYWDYTGPSEWRAERALAP